MATSTQRSYERDLKRIEAAIGAVPVTEVDAGDIVDVIERNHALGWVEAQMLLVTLKVLFKHAAGRKLIKANPCSGVQLSALRGERTAPKKRLMLSGAEIHAVMTAKMSRENALALRVLLATGVRVSELYTAQWQHIDLDAGNWHLPRARPGPRWTFLWRPPSSMVTGATGSGGWISVCAPRQTNVQRPRTYQQGHAGSGNRLLDDRAQAASTPIHAA
ncbi:tyrosine-type recombinase/integrase [Cupriavidus taiwanensis]|uniref:Phage integrase (Part 2) n=1 Tax=Cupriavidus taiwanensis (strain DSM 17343 / BCRC 17206 / CCUG 44338 / CIP 107171 / LMG 19424 / R1) TaxID=977880 RepID=B3R3D5_CUPTR|nr:tyrosine-type recombinase/integrase [Cupriavidus taiwanensis]CAQ68817.1 putative phage integrase (part 2) [Cupriavidus taiwanensis LMG 19424]